MAFVSIEPTRLAAAHRYANLIRNKRKRDFANAYINWWINGGEGLEPDRGSLSAMAAQAVRLEIDALELWGTSGAS